VTARELIEDLASVGQRPGEPVELGNDERVAVAACRQRLAQARPIAIGAGESVVDVDAFRADSKCRQRLALRGDVLLVGGHAGIADHQRRHEVLLASGRRACHPDRYGSLGWRSSAGGGRRRCFSEVLVQHHDAPERARL
jgi:hypothetical protein